MAVFLLLLLLLLAAAGVLGAVLKFTLVMFLSLLLTIVLLFWIGAWYAKRRMRVFRANLQEQTDRERRRRQAYDVEPDRGSRGLPGGD